MRFSDFTVNFEQTSHCPAVFIADFEQLYFEWVVSNFIRLKFHAFRSKYQSKKNNLSNKLIN